MSLTGSLFEPPFLGPSPNDPHSQQNKTPVEAPTEPQEAQDEATRKEEEGEIREVHALLNHKLLGNKSVDLLVHWEGESVEVATWVPETEIQPGASELLFDYWEKVGGRDQVLFKNEEAKYHIFKILKHTGKPRGGFKLECQWVGYPASKGHTSWETEAKLRGIAPELLKSYWERNSAVIKRDRAHENRSGARD
ncbi:hypothetical protein Micbo1qcDRAFT_70214 [Microdochium bolleyi]|uniref:Chromo domain-containing protein n=1 Tax=Microdochium bolleyi TaxID=196109 RepID=A0A136IIQ9_9PEZI|nr:hypothetical protein Micbo1qcDRAFT_70214 [Microdochium bolleyi]